MYEAYNSPTNFHAAVTAAKENDVEKLKSLSFSSDFNKPNVSYFGPLHVAAALGHLEAVKYLCEFINPSMLDGLNKHTALHRAAIHGRDDVIDYLIVTQKVDPNILSSDGHTPLHYAVGNRRISTINTLLERGGDPTAKVNNDETLTPLHMAEQDKNITQRTVDNMKSKAGWLDRKIRMAAKL